MIKIDFINKVSDKQVKYLKQNDIETIDLYTNIDMDFNCHFNEVSLVVAKSCLYVVDITANKIIKYERDSFDDLVIESLLTISRIYLVKNKEKTLIGFCSKRKAKNISLFARYFIKACDDKLTNEDYNNKDVLALKVKVCPRCHREYDVSLAYCDKCKSAFSTMLRLLGYSRKYVKELVFLVIALLVSALIGIFTPIYTGTILYDEVLAKTGEFFGKILGFTLILVAIKFVSFIFDVIFGRTVAKASGSLCLDLKNDVFASMQKLPLSFFTSQTTGNLINRVVWDANEVFYFLIDMIPNLFVRSLQIAGIVIFLFILNPILALCVVIPVPLLVFIIVKTGPSFRYYWHQTHIKQNKMTSIISDTLEGFRIVKTFSGTDKEIRRFGKSSDEVADIQTKRTHNYVKIVPFINLFTDFIVYLVWGVGGYFVITGYNNFSYGELMTFIAAMALVYSPLNYLVSSVVNDLPRVINSGRRMFEIIDASDKKYESPNNVDIIDFKGNIEFNNVSFSYEVNKPILENISFKLEANKTLGLVGKTGVGKTTIVNLLNGLYEVNEGIIKLDGINISTIKSSFLHKNVAMISQDIYLFKGTVMENIAYACENASKEQIIESAKKAHAHEFIMKLSNGYDTLIGEGNQSLSGGEKQRISIARAILLDAKIIVFDEATSSLDSKTERDIQQSIDKLKQGKTVILIAHRLSTLKDVDRLIVIDDKKIIEEGTMEELINLKGTFYELYDKQMSALKHIGVGE